MNVSYYIQSPEGCDKYFKINFLRVRFRKDANPLKLQNSDV